MALVPIRIPRTSKPPLGTPIDWSNPLTQGLVGAWAFNEGAGAMVFDASGVAPPGNIGSATKWQADRLRSSGSGGATDYVSIPATPVQALLQYTVLHGFTVNAVNNNNTLWSRGSSPAFMIAYIASGMGQFNYAGTSIGVTPLVGIPYVTAVVQKTGAGTPFLVFVNGAWRFSSSFGGAPNTTAANWVFGNGIAGAFKATPISQDFALLFNRELSPAEISSLSANPWQIYEPEIMWVNVGGVVASFTGTYAAIQAAQSQSLSASLEFNGTSVQSQTAQSQMISALLQFTGATAQQQAANTEALSAILSFDGNISQVQSLQAQAIYQALLNITGTVSQAQVKQIINLVASLTFNGNISQSQAIQIENLTNILIASYFKSSINTISTVLEYITIMRYPVNTNSLYIINKEIKTSN